MVQHLLERPVVVYVIIAVVIFAGCSSNRDGREIITRVVLPDSSGVSIFELLDAYHEIEFQETSSGAFVTSIDSIPNTRSSYWLYFVNDSAGTVASDRYILEGGEKVEWRLVSGY